MDAKKETDKQLAQLEKKLTKMYAEASKDIAEKWDNYMKKSQSKVDELFNAYLAAERSGNQDEAKKALETYQNAAKSITIGNEHYNDMLKSVTKDMAAINQTALSYINGTMPAFYTLNYNANSDISDVLGVRFDLVDEHTVKRLVLDKRIKLPKKKVNIPKDMKWNAWQLNSSVLQGILQGESMDKIAKRIMPIVGNNRKAAIRNARTMVTGAQNRGHLDGMEELSDEGVVLKKVWMATPDSRTRDWHLEMDGQEVDLDENFVDGLGNELEYPGDPSAEPETVYNCRCTMITHVVGFRRDDGSISLVDYDRMKSEHEEAIEDEREIRRSESYVYNVVNGNDISESWKRRPDQFDFEIEDVINAQGFDGVPRVVSADEFDKHVKESNFIAQRTYSAPDQETLDAYRDQLYYGKWYVDCSAGGGLYGQGMYATAGFGGNITEEMKAANRFYSIRFGSDRAVRTEDFTLIKDVKTVEYYDLYDDFMRAKLKGITTIEDVGSYGVAKGYDAIIVRGEGAYDTDEIIILNRTKLIIKGE